MALHTVFKSVFVRGFAPLMAASSLVLLASPALADWKKYESPRFELYSSGSDREAREMLIELEKFDYVLRLFMGQDVNSVPHRKLPIYLVSDSGLGTIWPGARDRIAGFYTSSDEDIFAVATRGENNHTLKHEYAHHFMMADLSYPYPSWFVEGFAEYYAPTEFRARDTRVGIPNQNRAMALSYLGWISMSELLSNRPMVKARNSDSYYPLAWLLTHWFMSDTERRKTLGVYLAAVGDGADPAQAMQDATGMTTTELQRTLRRYMRDRMTYVVMKTSFDQVEIAVTPMPKSAYDILLLNQRLKVGVPEERRAATAEDVRRVAARHPDDPLALLALGHAELHFGDAAAAEAPLQRLLTIQPDHVEGLQYLARARMDAAAEEDDAEAALKLKIEAQHYLSRAYAADDANFASLLLIAENRADAHSYPNDNDVAVLEQAFILAPQLGTVRFNLAQALLEHDRKAEAATLLQPLVNNPHAPNASARALLREIEGRAEADEEEETSIDDGDQAQSEPADDE